MPIDDAKAAALLKATTERLSPPATPTPEPVAASEPETAPVAEKGAQPDPTPTPVVAEEKAKATPDLSWMPPEYREGFKSLPEQQQKYLREVRGHIVAGAEDAFQRAAKYEKDAKKWQQMESDEDFRRDLAAARRQRVESPNGNGHAQEAPKPKWFDAATDEEFDAAVVSRVREIVTPLLEDRLSAPERHAQAVDKAIDSYRDTLNGVVEAEVFDAAKAALSDDLSRKTNGRPYTAIKPDDVALVMPAYVRAARAEHQAKSAAAQVQATKTPTPAPLTAKTASIKGLGSGGPGKPEPTHKREGRAPSAEEFFRTRMSEVGLTDEQLTALKFGRSIPLT